MGYVILLWHSLSLPYNYFERPVHHVLRHFRDNPSWLGCFEVCFNYIIIYNLPSGQQYLVDIKFKLALGINMLWDHAKITNIKYIFDYFQQ